MDRDFWLRHPFAGTFGALRLADGFHPQIHGEPVEPTNRKLERYHLLEHLYEGANSLPQELGMSAGEWIDEQLSRIDTDQASKVISHCRSLARPSPDHPLGRLAGYLQAQMSHLDYQTARNNQLPVGSGAVEGGHRHIIQARLKLPGAWWNHDTVNPMLALRTLRVNGWWESFWN